ncbi:MAG: hypothetical protein EGQ57_09205 [Alphaproteobacteria bacterium]|nr:hypothetical protein [Alphaproteobacteria bacterium]
MTVLFSSVILGHIFLFVIFGLFFYVMLGFNPGISLLKYHRLTPLGLGKFRSQAPLVSQLASQTFGSAEAQSPTSSRWSAPARLNLDVRLKAEHDRKRERQ